MFPDNLEGAKVIEYTERGNYGFVVDVQEDKVIEEEEICYVAIGQYENSDKFTVFWCNEEYRVLKDWSHDDLEECERSRKTAGAVWHRK